jgi:hypothetical protein
MKETRMIDITHASTAIRAAPAEYSDVALRN